MGADTERLALARLATGFGELGHALEALAAAGNGSPERLSYRLSEVADVVGVSVSTVNRLIDAGRLAAVQVTPTIRVVPRWALEQFLNDT